MAASEGSSLGTPPFNPESDGGENIKKDLSELMDQLKQNTHHVKSWIETSKALRNALTDKQHQVDGTERTFLVRQLHALRKAVRASTGQLLLERVEHSCQQVAGLQVTAPSPGSVLLTAEMFHAELSLEASGRISEVKVVHASDPSPINCPELADTLRQGKFEEFRAHLEGMSALYQINADKKQKGKAYLALQALETDLSNVSKLQSSISSVSSYVHKSPLGILKPRTGGLPMRMVYFVSPYDLINRKSKSTSPMTIESIVAQRVGLGVSVGIETSQPRKLQTIPLMSVTKSLDGKTLPSFSPMTSLNSCTLPAVFSLRLDQPLPVSLAQLGQIMAITGVEQVEQGSPSLLMPLVISTIGSIPYCSDQGLHVSLPGQMHRYYVSESASCPHHMGALVSRISFSHPTSVPAILRYLRQQALYNTLLGSCVRTHSHPGSRSGITFEVTTLSVQRIGITFEHPYLNAIATAELDLSDLTAVKCHLSCSDNNSDDVLDTEDYICSDEYATKVLQKCLSIPVMLRSVLQKAVATLEKRMRPPTPVSPPTPIEPVTLAPIPQQGRQRRQGLTDNHVMNMVPEIPGVPSVAAMHQVAAMQSQLPPASLQPVAAMVRPMVKVEPRMQEVVRAGYEGHYRGLDPSHENLVAMQEDKRLKNPMLASLLDQDNSSPEALAAIPITPPLPILPPAVHQTSMLSALLNSDNSPSSSSSASQQAVQPVGEKKKGRKRRLGSEKSPAGRSPKRQVSEDNLNMLRRDFNSHMHDVDGSNNYSAGGYDSGAVGGSSGSGSVSTPSSGTPNTTPSGGTSANSDGYPATSHVTKLESTVDSIIKQEAVSFTSPSQVPPHHSHPASELHSHFPSERDLKRPKSESSIDKIELSSLGFTDHGGGGGMVMGGGGVMVEARLAPLRRSNSSIDDASTLNLDAEVFHKKDYCSHTKPPSNKSMRTKSQECVEYEVNSGLTENSETHLVGAYRTSRGLDNGPSTKLLINSNHDRMDIRESKVHLEEVKVKERRKDKLREIRESVNDDPPQRFPEPKEQKLAITVKLNTKERTARTYIKESPHHRSDSPQEVDVGWREKVKVKTEVKGHGMNSEPSIDLTSDNEVDGKSRSLKSSYDSGASHSQSQLQSGSQSQQPPSQALPQSQPQTQSLRLVSGTHREIKEKLKGEKRRRSSKHGGADGDADRKRRREETRRDQLKKQHIYDFDDGEPNDKDYRAEKVKPTTIKIKQGTAKTFAISNARVGSSSKTHSGVNSPLRTVKSGSDKSTPSPKLRLSSSQRQYVRSKSETGVGATANSTGSDKVDSKLAKIPQVKLKPVNISTSSMMTVTSSSSAKAMQTPLSAPVSKSVSLTISQQALAKAKVLGSKSKKDLTSIIDDLKRRSSKGPGDGKDSKGSLKKDQNLYDAIRLQIIREGNKPSTPTKEFVASMKSSQKSKSDSSKLTQKGESFAKNDNSLTRGSGAIPPPSSGNLVIPKAKGSVATPVTPATVASKSHPSTIPLPSVRVNSSLPSASSALTPSSATPSSSITPLLPSAASVSSHPSEPPPRPTADHHPTNKPRDSGASAPSLPPVAPPGILKNANPVKQSPESPPKVTNSPLTVKHVIMAMPASPDSPMKESVGSIDAEPPKTIPLHRENSHLPSTSGSVGSSSPQDTNWAGSECSGSPSDAGDGSMGKKAKYDAELADRLMQHKPRHFLDAVSLPTNGQTTTSASPTTTTTTAVPTSASSSGQRTPPVTTSSSSSHPLAAAAVSGTLDKRPVAKSSPAAVTPNHVSSDSPHSSAPLSMSAPISSSTTSTVSSSSSSLSTSVKNPSVCVNADPLHAPVVGGKRPGSELPSGMPRNKVPVVGLPGPNKLVAGNLKSSSQPWHNHRPTDKPNHAKDSKDVSAVLAVSGASPLLHKDTGPGSSAPSGITAGKSNGGQQEGGTVAAAGCVGGCSSNRSLCNSVGASEPFPSKGLSNSTIASEDKENVKKNAKEIEASPFRAPSSPRSPAGRVTSEEKEMSGGGRLGDGPNKVKRVLSPHHSPISSPEDGSLVIDYPVSPRANACSRSPSVPHSPPRSPALSKVSPLTQNARSPSPYNSIMKSPSAMVPVTSPNLLRKNSSSSPICRSPSDTVDIDDDLMNAALGVLSSS